MIAVDTNILVYAHREDSPHHARALEALTNLATGRSAWCIPWPCVHEFLAVVTHRRIYEPPTDTATALAAIDALVSSGQCHLIGESAEHLEILHECLVAANVAGARVHDARIAAICLAHGVDSLWSADRDFSYFPALKVKNPLVG